MRIKIATPKVGTSLLKLVIKEGKENVFVIDCGEKGIKKSQSVKINFFDDFEISYDVSKSDKQSFEAKLLLTDGDYDELEIVLNINKEKGNYTITFDESSKDNNYTDKSVIKGSYEKDGDTVLLSVDKITNTWGYSQTSVTIYTIKCYISINMNDRMPKPIEDYKHINDIKERELKSWIKELEKIL